MNMIPIMAAAVLNLQTQQQLRNTQMITTRPVSPPAIKRRYDNTSDGVQSPRGIFNPFKYK